MLRRLFFYTTTLGVAVTAIVAIGSGVGCSPDDANRATDVIDATPDRTPVTPPPPEEDAEAGPATCPPTETITVEQITEAVGWKPPGAIQTVCTQANVDALKTLFENAGNDGVAFTAIQGALGEACSACVFSSKDGANWSVFVEVPDSGFIDNSSGSCFAHASNPACGKARAHFERCLRATCTVENCGASNVQKCYADTQQSACKEVTEAYVAACPDENGLIDTCETYYAAIAAGCSGGVDAGIDAASP